MTTNVKNNHATALSVGGVSIPAGATAAVPNWEIMQNSHAVKAWVEAGILEVEGGSKPDKAGMPGMPGVDSNGKPMVPGIPTPDEEDAEKEAIIAELKANHGIEKTKRSSLESLRKELADAKAAE